MFFKKVKKADLEAVSSRNADQERQENKMMRAWISFGVVIILLILLFFASINIGSLKVGFGELLSGGQRQRVFIAMALAQNTKILFLDEPTTYLDIRYQLDILRLVKKLNREYGITIVMVLHEINQAIHFSDEVIGLKDGKVLVQGDPKDVITTESISELYDVHLNVADIDGQKFVLTV